MHVGCYTRVSNLVQSPLYTQPHPLQGALRACLVEQRPPILSFHSFRCSSARQPLRTTVTMPSKYSTIFLSGQGLAGIFAALAMLISMASK